MKRSGMKNGSRNSVKTGEEVIQNLNMESRNGSFCPVGIQFLLPPVGIKTGTKKQGKFWG